MCIIYNCTEMESGMHRDAMSNRKIKVGYHWKITSSDEHWRVTLGGHPATNIGTYIGQLGGYHS